MRTFLSILAGIVLSVNLAAAKHPAFTVKSIKLERGQDPQVGGIDVMPNGKIAVTFHEGDIRLYDPEANTWSLFATGLHEPLGLVVEDNQTVVVAQRPELTRISDTDGNGIADTYTTICDDYGLSGNYHEFAFGPARDKEGNYYVSLNVASNGAPIREEIRGEWLELGLPRDQFYVSSKEWKEGIKKKAGRMYSRVPYRGWVVKIDSQTGEMTPWASGFRSPNGLGFDANGKLFVSDNQGDWLGTSKLHHVEKGKFHGHPASLPWTEDYEGPASVDQDIAVLEELRTPAAVWFPQSTMANSPTQPILIPEGFGDFGGQMLIGEMNKSRIIRLILEEVNGVTQGACTPLIDQNGLDMGINRFAFDSKGALYVGHSHLSWPGGEGFTKITYDDQSTFQDVKDIKITPDGFLVEFLEEIPDPAALKDITLSRYTFSYHEKYGSDKVGKEDVTLKASPIEGSPKKVQLTLQAPHKKDYCYEFHFPMSVNPLLCYTAREIPASKLPTSEDPTDNYNWVDLLANDSLTQWRNGSKASRGRIKGVGKLWSIQDGVLTLDKSKKGRGGHIITKQEDYFDFELKFEFLISKEGNSGLKYRVDEQTVGLEYQIFDDAKSKVSKNSVASLYNIKAPLESKKAKQAGSEWNSGRILAVGNSIKHWLNGELAMEIEFNSEEWKEAFAKSKFKEYPQFAKRPGPILLQDHRSSVKFRNIKIRKVMSTE